MNKKELYHHGIKGMKWGVRRYQNSDGTLTKAGKTRYEQDAKKNHWEIGEDGLARGTGKKNKGEVYYADPNEWVKNDIKIAKSSVDSVSKLNNTLMVVNKKATDKEASKRPKMDLSNMTDQQMRERINRALLEKQYNDMFAPRKVSKGREMANNVMDSLGTTLTLTSSALAIALAIKELKG